MIFFEKTNTLSLMLSSQEKRTYYNDIFKKKKSRFNEKSIQYLIFFFITLL